MLRSEKRSLARFLLIYLLSTFLLFSVAAWMFYASAKHHLLDRQKEVLKYRSEQIKSTLRALHQSNAEQLVYPDDPVVKSAIYDVEKRYIFGSLQPPQSLEYRDGNRLYYVAKIEPYYLGAAYLLLSKAIDHTPIVQLQKNILLFMVGAGIFFTILGFYLGRLFIAPMRESIERMNHFIQDTTHELNTPISTILTNIEMIETFGKSEEQSEELKRIEIASKTLSRIYDDLTYLNLNHRYHRSIVRLDMSTLVEERMVYFSAMAEAKGLHTLLNISPEIYVEMDRNDAFRLVDNLISNAIKYNKPNGRLEIGLMQEGFWVKDTGTGIRKEDMAMILQRFKRADKSEGGFGIGLDIVSQVVKSYGFELSIESQEHRGTEVFVKWKKA